MHRYFLLFISAFLFLVARSQTAAGIIAELKNINQSVIGKACGADSAAAISHRAMNVFMADKTGYLAASTDLSFYTNYVTLNTAEGKITVNHNFQQPSGKDDPIKNLLSVGFDMTIANPYSKGFLDNRFENELGATVNYKWLGKVRTSFKDCLTNGSRQKKAMDALRALLVHSIENDIEKEEINFQQELGLIDASAVPGQDIDSAKDLIRQHHYAGLKKVYEEKFVTQQAVLLTQTLNFKRISTGWTSVTAYLPLFFAKYTTASTLTSTFGSKHPYPFNIMLSHTRLWESSKTGRTFFTLGASLLLNNSKLSYGLNKLNFSEYKSLGGTDNTQSIDPGNNKLYIGDYQTFITPSVTIRGVYFPTTSHVGISVLAEQHFGQYNLLDAKIGIPIVLMNSKKTPAVNIECYVLVFDLGNTNRRLIEPGKTSLGISVGMPFSRLMY